MADGRSKARIARLQRATDQLDIQARLVGLEVRFDGDSFLEVYDAGVRQVMEAQEPVLVSQFILGAAWAKGVDPEILHLAVKEAFPV